MKPKLVVLISGSGSNLQAIIDAINDKTLTAEIALVVSNRKDAYGLTRAAQANIPTLYFPLKPYKEDGRGRAQYDRDLAARISEAKPDLIVLAGWMHVLTADFLNQFPRKVINLHPALPGTFVGTHGIEQAFTAWQQGQIRESGCMVHYVIPEVDRGEVIDTAIVPFQDDDTLETYTERVHAAEHTLILSAIRKVLEPSMY